MRLIHFLRPQDAQAAEKALKQAGFKPEVKYIPQTAHHPCGYVICGEDVDEMHDFLKEHKLRNNGVKDWEV